jgi:hypothetical protein
VMGNESESLAKLDSDAAIERGGTTGLNLVVFGRKHLSAVKRIKGLL